MHFRRFHCQGHLDASPANRVRPSVAFPAEKAPALVWGPLRELGAGKKVSAREYSGGGHKYLLCHCQGHLDASLANRVRPSVAFPAEKAPALFWGPFQ